MADQKTTQLTALTAPTTDDILPIVDDPAGTPVLKKIAISDLLKLFVSNVVVQTFGAGSGTYTPTALMKKCLVILVGGGGAGASVTGVDQNGGGGGGGGTCIKLFTAADIGASKPYVVGAAGNNSTFNTTTLVANTGAAGSASADSATVGTSGAGGAGGTASGGDLNIPGEPGGRGVNYDTTNGTGGAGGRSVFGAGGAMSGTEAAGNAGAGYGGGGSGAHCGGGVDRSGGAGAAGVMYVIEFLD